MIWWTVEPSQKQTSSLRSIHHQATFDPETTDVLDVGGWAQGAVLEVGIGRMAMFGEAAMFSAQEQIGREEHKLMGMNRPDAEQNPQFLLNVMHWLSGLIG